MLPKAEISLDLMDHLASIQTSWLLSTKSNNSNKLLIQSSFFPIEGAAILYV